MKFIRKIIYSILGFKLYLKLVSKTYLKLILNGKLKKEYPEIHFLKNIVKAGDTVIDIGANLGYYSTVLSKIVKNEGTVYAVEPIPLFGEIWKKNVRLSKINNLVLFPFALGNSESIVQMGIPKKDGVIHHGMTKITSTAHEEYIRFYDVEMKNPDILFSEIKTINFIKCDVEGYEFNVFSSMIETIKKHKPLIQSELSGKENRSKVIELFESMGYCTYYLKNNQLLQATPSDKEILKQDFYFKLL